MPWQEPSVLQQRVDFVHDLIRARAGDHARVCRQYGISRQTGYKWRARFEAGGVGALADASSKPHGHPAAVDPVTRAAIVEARRRHPSWGARKLRAWFRNHGAGNAFPVASTIHQILTVAGLVPAQPRRARAAHPGGAAFEAAAPNDVWSIDFKGEFKTRDGVWCYPLTVLDGMSRFALSCEALVGPRFAPTQAAMRRTFREYGLPDRMRSDNGGPFAHGTSLARLSRLSCWWLQLGIIPETITPASPQENGRHERFHRTLKQETTRPPARSRRPQQQRFRRFLVEYNQERPHEALDNMPPAHYYHASARPFPDRLPPPQYPSHAQVRTVNHGGWIRWQGAIVQLTTVLRGERVALTEVDDGIWRVYYYAYQLGDLDERTGKCTGVSRITPPNLSTPLSD